MQEDKFSAILKEHADRFRVDPPPALFDRVLSARAERSRRPRLVVVLFAVLGAAGLIAGTAAYLNVANEEPIAATATKSAPTPATNEPLFQRTEKNAGTTQPEQIASPPSAVPSEPENSQAARSHTVKRDANSSEEMRSPGRKRKSLARQNLNAAPDQPVSQPAHVAATVASYSAKAGIEPHSGTAKQANKTESVEQGHTSAPSASAMADLNESEKEAVPTKAKSESPTASQAPSVTDESPAEQAKPLSDTSEFAQASPVEAAAPPKPTAIKLPRRWAVSLLFTPQFANSAYSANSSADLEWFNDYYHNRVNNDKARFCYNAGLKAEGRFGKHFGIATGGIVSVIQFEELQVIKTIDTLPQPTTKVSTGTVVVPLLDSLGRPIAQTTANIDRNRVDISFTSLEIPLLMNYTVDGKRFQWQLSAGVGYNYLLSTHSLVFEKNDTLNAQETNDASNSRLQQHRFSFIAGLYVAYRFTPGFAFYIGPSYRQSLGSLYNEDYVIRQRPYFIGAECGLKFSF